MEKMREQPLTAELLLEEIRVILKDSFVARVRKTGDEIELRFPGGETFRLTLWQQPPRRTAGGEGKNA